MRSTSTKTFVATKNQIQINFLTPFFHSFIHLQPHIFLLIDGRKIMNENQWFEFFVKEFCFGDRSDPMIHAKPTPMLWSYYFLHCMKLNKDRGVEFSKKCVREIKTILEDTLTTLQELVLEGDPDTVKIQIKKQLEFENEEGI
jgi:hypothetical protein